MKLDSAAPPPQDAAPPSIETSLALINERLGKIEKRREPKLKISDMFTALAVLTSMFVATNSWSKDRALARREQAQSIRAGVGKAMANLDKCASLTMSVFDDSKLIVQKTKKTLELYNHQGKLDQDKITEVRNQTFNDMLVMHIKVIHTIENSQLELGASDIAGYPDLRKKYKETIKALRKVEADSATQIRSMTQAQVLSCEGKKFDSAQFWNELFNDSNGKLRIVRDLAQKDVDNIVNPVIGEFDGFIEKSDRALIHEQD